MDELETKIEEARKDLKDALESIAKDANRARKTGGARSTARRAHEVAKYAAHVAVMAGRLEMLLDLYKSVKS